MVDDRHGNPARTITALASKWIKKQVPALSGFSWQRGYGCFSVGPKDVPRLCDYIETQEERHRTKSFQKEFRELLGRYEVTFDEAHVWD